MTTTEHPDRGYRRRSARVLLLAVGAGAATVALVALAGGVAAGSSGALGALAGGGIALVFLVFGAVSVGLATRVAPQASLLVALTTYTLQILVVAVVFVVLDRSGVLDGALSAGWLALGVVGATLAWTIGHLLGSTRARIPAYDIELPGESGEPPPGSGGPRNEGPEGPSRPREVGAP